MNRDLILGIIISAVLHLAVFFGDRLMPTPTVVKKVVEEVAKVQLMEMPKLEEEPEIIETKVRQAGK